MNEGKACVCTSLYTNNVVNQSAVACGLEYSKNEIECPIVELVSRTNRVVVV